MRDPAQVIDDFVAPLDAGGPYRPPTTGESRRFVQGLCGVMDGRRGQLTSLGFAEDAGTDPRTGRDYTLVRSEPGGERAWGLFVIDRSAPIRLLVEVPHPNADLRTEDVGLALFRRVPGSLLLVAGAHRRAARGAADVAHRADSVFHAVCAGLGVPQVQLHGFGDGSLPSHDVVVSPGVGEAGATVRRVAERLDEARFAVCRSWRRNCGDLTGTTNVQGIAAAASGTVFVHIELNRTVRHDPVREAAVVDALVAADLAG